MACTTILVGKNASYDGSTMIARNDDSGSGHFTAKKFVVIHPEEQLKVYKSVLSHAEIDPGDPMKFTAVPNAIKRRNLGVAALMKRDSRRQLRKRSSTLVFSEQTRL